MSSLRFRWRALSAPLAVFLLVLISAVPTMSLAQTSTAPTGHAQVIAQGVDLMPRVPVAWRMTESQAAPADEAGFFARTVGFTIGTGDPVLVTDGALQVTDADGEVTELDAGDALETTGPLGLLAGASVEVPPASVPDAETGSLELRLEACPDTLEADCTPIPNTDVTVPAFHLVEDDGNWIIPDRADLSDDDTALTYDDLPAGQYVTMPVENAVPGVTIDGAAWDDDLEGWAFEVEPGETTELTLKVIVDDRGETGSLLVTLYDCPAGSDPERDPSPCDLTSDPWDVSIVDIGQSGTTEWPLANDALDLGDSQYWFELLPAASLVFYPDGAREVGTSDVVVTGDPYVLGNLWTIDIPYHGAAEATLYRVQPDNEPVGGTGSLVIYQSDCPYGVDPSADTSACVTSTDPWAVTVTNDATGESWDVLFEGVAYDTGTYVLEALPAGSYSIDVSSNENWTLSYPTTTDVSADDETYVTIYSVDLRAP